MIKPIEMYKVICDRCGKDAFEDSDFSCWESPETAREYADYGDWNEIEGKDYCFSCCDWDEETDEYIPLPPIESNANTQPSDDSESDRNGEK